MHACVTLPVVFQVSLHVGLGQGDGTDGEAMERHRANLPGVRWCLGSIVVASDWDPGMFTEWYMKHYETTKQRSLYSPWHSEHTQ